MNGFVSLNANFIFSFLSVHIIFLYFVLYYYHLKGFWRLRDEGSYLQCSAAALASSVTYSFLHEAHTTHFTLKWDCRGSVLLVSPSSSNENELRLSCGVQSGEEFSSERCSVSLWNLSWKLNSSSPKGSTKHFNINKWLVWTTSVFDVGATGWGFIGNLLKEFSVQEKQTKVVIPAGTKGSLATFLKWFLQIWTFCCWQGEMFSATKKRSKINNSHKNHPRPESDYDVCLHLSARSSQQQSGPVSDVHGLVPLAALPHQHWHHVLHVRVLPGRGRRRTRGWRGWRCEWGEPGRPQSEPRTIAAGWGKDGWMDG